MNVYFYSPSTVLIRHSKPLYINTVPLYLDSYIQNHAPHLYPYLNWCKIQLLQKTQDELINQLQQLDADMLCMSSYIWNHDHLISLVSGIKQFMPHLIVVIGGPAVDVYRNNQFLDHHPDVDYAVYSQGEEAFVEILEHQINQRYIDRLRASNLSWRTTQGIRVANHRVFRRTSGSFYLDSQHLLRQVVNDPEYQGRSFALPYETSHGCPYKCSFCDWTSGLSHKVVKRKFDYRQEFELFGDLNILNFYMADANMGQWDVDMDIARAMVELKQTRGFQFNLDGANFSKTNKKLAFEIIDLLTGAGILTRPKISVQDIHQDILKQNQRPDIPWLDHKEYIHALKHKYPHVLVLTEIIIGLVGQTRNSLRSMLQEIARNRFTPFIPHAWILLPNSPAGYDSKFQQDAQIQSITMTSSYFLHNPSEVVVATKSFDINDYAYFLQLTTVYHMLTGEFHLAFHRLSYDQSEAVIDAVLDHPVFQNMLAKTSRNITQGVEVFDPEIIRRLLMKQLAQTQ